MKLLWLRYYNALKKRAVWIVLLVFLSVSTSGFMSYFVVEPSYKATTKMVVNMKPTLETQFLLNELMADQRVIKTYNEIIKSYAVAQDVIERTKLSLTPAQVAAKVAVSTVADSQVINVTVTDNDPVRVVLLADEVSISFMNKAAQLMQVDNVVILDRAIDKPASKLNPKPTVNMAVAALMGLSVGCGLFILLEYLDPTLKTKIEVQEILNLPVIGEIGRWEQAGGAGRTGAAPVKNRWLRRKSTAPEATPLNMTPSKRNRLVLENYRQMYQNLVPFHLMQEVRTVLFTSTVRGEGKSSVMTHFGILQAQNGQRVLLIDAEFEHAALHRVFQLPNDLGLSECLTGQADLSQAASGTAIANLHVLTTGRVTAGAARGLGGQEFVQLLKEARAAYDIVLIDCSTVAESLLPQTLAPETDGVLYVVGSGTVKRDHAILGIEALKACGANLIGTVLNASEGKSVRSKFFLDRLGKQQYLVAGEDMKA